MDVATFMEKQSQYLAPAYHRYVDILFVRGEGSYLYDSAGRKYLDFATGIATTVLGHCHPKVVKRAKDQLDKLVHLSVVAPYEPPVQLAEILSRYAPGDLGMCFFTNSGAESVEGALKLAKIFTRRPAVISFRGSFHGRTLGALSVTNSKGVYHYGYRPLLPDVYVTSYADPSQFPGRPDPKLAAELALEELNRLFLYSVSPEDVAAIIVEPALGEGGYIFAHPDFLKGIREICNKHGIVMIVDEVQTGMGRTGKMFACEHAHITPDIITMAKGIANGLPLGAVVSKRDIMAGWFPGSHGSTFGGNPVSCAAAIATIETIEEEGLIERAGKLGKQALATLKELGAHPAVTEVRGLGLMMAVEFVSSEVQNKVRKKCLENGLIVVYCGLKENVIRLMPPLNIADADLERGIEILKQAVQST
jgi:4-aminobutyrate aminotransferase